jgi:hypothetical protein
MSGDPATQHDETEKPDALTEEKSDPSAKAIEGSSFGTKVKIPWAWAVFVGPYMKWPIIAFSAGLFVMMVFYAISLVVKK